MEHENTNDQLRLGVTFNLEDLRRASDLRSGASTAYLQFLCLRVLYVEERDDLGAMDALIKHGFVSNHAIKHTKQIFKGKPLQHLISLSSHDTVLGTGPGMGSMDKPGGLLLLRESIWQLWTVSQPRYVSNGPTEPAEAPPLRVQPDRAARSAPTMHYSMWGTRTGHMNRC